MDFIWNFDQLRVLNNRNIHIWNESVYLTSFFCVVSIFSPLAYFRQRRLCITQAHSGTHTHGIVFVRSTWFAWKYKNHWNRKWMQDIFSAIQSILPSFYLRIKTSRLFSSKYSRISKSEKQTHCAGIFTLKHTRTHSCTHIYHAQTYRVGIFFAFGLASDCRNVFGDVKFDAQLLVAWLSAIYSIPFAVIGYKEQNCFVRRFDVGFVNGMQM